MSTDEPTDRAEDEALLRLVVFGAAVLLIATRERIPGNPMSDALEVSNNSLGTFDNYGNPLFARVDPPRLTDAALNEARETSCAVVDSIVLEAQRLRAGKPHP